MPMDSEAQLIVTALLQFGLSIIFLIKAVVTLIASKLVQCCPCPCSWHRDLEEEVEKERSASATAAEEAMAMISRLQKEKASIEMEARQYRRAAEQRQLHDRQVIDFLREVVLKLEKERCTYANGDAQEQEQMPQPKLQCCCAFHRELEQELEKERNANATAAEQAMAMISRLQKEKASLEMDARQYCRTAEQRHLHNLQTINFLKEIVLKLEREKYASQRYVAFTFPTKTTPEKKQRPLCKVLLQQS